MTNILPPAVMPHWTLVDNPSSTAITIRCNWYPGRHLQLWAGRQRPQSELALRDNNNSALALSVEFQPSSTGQCDAHNCGRLNTGAGANTLATLNQSVARSHPFTSSVLRWQQHCRYDRQRHGWHPHCPALTLTRINYNVASRGTGVVTVASSGLIQCSTLWMSRGNASTTGSGSVGVVHLNGGALGCERVAQRPARLNRWTPTGELQLQRGHS